MTCKCGLYFVSSDEGKCTIEDCATCSFACANCTPSISSGYFSTAPKLLDKPDPVYPLSNPKTLMGSKKIPLLSVLPSAALVHMADAMRFGAYEAPRVDGSKGYGRYNWRDQPIEAAIYIDAAVRHLLQWYDGEDVAQDSKAHHLGHAMATIGILLDALENGTAIDDRPRVRSAVVTKLLDRMKKKS